LSESHWVPLTDEQWASFRDQMEAIAEGNARTPEGHKVNPVELAEMVLLLMDRIDDLEKRIHDVA
jgi:hypothetical protein